MQHATQTGFMTIEFLHTAIIKLEGEHARSIAPDAQTAKATLVLDGFAHHPSQLKSIVRLTRL